MPTKKPRIQIILENEYAQKFKELCKQDGRTESNMGKRIIEKYIDNYESQYGEIKLEKE